MTQQLEHAWVREIFNPEELKQYAQFELNLKSKLTVEEKESFEASWFNLIKEVRNNLHMDPCSKIGIELGRAGMEIINGYYGKEHANLRAVKWQKGFKEGRGLHEHGLTPDIVNWLDQAFNAYWQRRIHEVLAEAEKITPSELQCLWNDVMDEMYGEDNQRKAEMLDLILRDNHVSQTVKNCLKPV